MVITMNSLVNEHWAMNSLKQDCCDIIIDKSGEVEAVSSILHPPAVSHVVTIPLPLTSWAPRIPYQNRNRPLRRFHFGIWTPAFIPISSSHYTESHSDMQKLITLFEWTSSQLSETLSLSLDEIVTVLFSNSLTRNPPRVIKTANLRHLFLVISLWIGHIVPRM